MCAHIATLKWLSCSVFEKIIDNYGFYLFCWSANGETNTHARRKQFDRVDFGRRQSHRAALDSGRCTKIYNLPFNDLLYRAQSTHRATFDPNAIQMSRLLSIKTGGCAEDCGYCSQSAHYPTGLKASKLMEVERVLAEARKARDGGATRYCMGAAWRSPKERDMEAIVAMISGVRALGMETCMTLGMLT